MHRMAKAGPILITHMPKSETARTEPRPVILIDGILILQHQPLRDLFDLSIFVECATETRLARRLERDVRERGRTTRSVQEQFANQVGPMHDLHVEPSKTYADIVVESFLSESDLEDLFQIIVSRM